MNKRNVVKIILGLTVLSSVTVYAGTSMLKEIKAYQKDVKFTLNDKEVMKNNEVIIFEDTIYVPVRAISETLNIAVKYQDNTIKLNDKNTKKCEDCIYIPSQKDLEKLSQHEKGIVKNYKN